MEQAEAIEFVREMAKGKTRYRTAKIIGATWGTIDKWLSKNPTEISYNYLQKLEILKNDNKNNPKLR